MLMNISKRIKDRMLQSTLARYPVHVRDGQTIDAIDKFDKS